MVKSKVTPPVLTSEGRTSDGRYAIDVLEYAALRAISPATAWRQVRAGRIRSMQPTGRNGRVQIPVHPVLAELGFGVAMFRRATAEQTSSEGGEF